MGEALDDAISLVGSRVALVAGPGVDNAFLARVRTLIHSTDPFGALVGAMTDAGLTNIPSLACAVTERGGVRLIVRGAGKALAKTVDGRSEVVTARRVSTWTEHALTDVEEVVLVAPNAQGELTSLVLFLDASHQRRTRVAGPPKARPEAALPPVRQPTPEPEPAPSPVALAPLPSFDPPPTFEPAAADGSPEHDFSHLIEDTRYRSVEDAAVRPPVDRRGLDPTAVVRGAVVRRSLVRCAPARRLADRGPAGERGRRHHDLHPTDAAPGSGRGGAPDPGDHDGSTISLSELREMTGSIRPMPQGEDGPQTALRGAVPLVGRLRFTDGRLVEVDRSLLLGRQPRYSASHADPRTAPRLITLADPDQSLSRTHVEVRVEGSEVLVIDLDSMNGTVVHLPGQAPRPLTPGEACPITAGSRVDLADEVSFTFEPLG